MLVVPLHIRDRVGSSPTSLGPSDTCVAMLLSLTTVNCSFVFSDNSVRSTNNLKEIVLINHPLRGYCQAALKRVLELEQSGTSNPRSNAPLHHAKDCW